ncbi:MAG: hypothetical protein IT380_28700 [Myxococcales bacterium]|nr:hypothetical protein [Myxococcales bacterium]
MTCLSVPLRLVATSLLLALTPACATAPVDTPDASTAEDAGAVDADAGLPDAGEPNACDRCTADEVCVAGTCVPRACGARLCGADEVCFDGGCAPLDCVASPCPAGTVCVAGGACVPIDCEGQVCPTGAVCDGVSCVEPACLGVTCDAGTCAGGSCPAAGCGTGGPCASGEACVNGRCVDARCATVSCAPGFQCVAGACVAGCTPSAATESACTDGRDEDCDGLLDCADPDCNGQACASDGQPCTTDVCGGGVCSHPVSSASVVCRPSIGGCDVEERCNGSAPTCPADVFSSTCACPERGPLAGYGEHDGPRAIVASSFVLKDSGTWQAWGQAIDALGLPRVALDALPLNRAATRMASEPWPGFVAGFRWESGDLTVPYWIPQGLTGGVAGARSYVAVSWHYDEAERAADPSPATDGLDKGSRVSFAEVSDLDTVTYRHVLLVEPDAARGFKPVTFHAGGLAWVGANLYVADTNRGVRVFDLTRVLQVSGASACSSVCGVANGVACAYGYAYVLPQVGAYTFPAGLSSSCRPTFSFIAFDRGTNPPTLLSGEYDNDPTWGQYSRLVRWPLAAGTGRLAVCASGVVTASGAWYAGSRNLQGAVSANGRFLMNATRYSGALILGAPGSASQVLRADQDDWGWMPEGIHVSAAGNVWNCTEGHASMPRSVYSVRLSGLP